MSRTVLHLLLFSLMICTAALGSLHAQGTPNVPLLAHLNQYPSAGYNDCWGYTAPDGREYALLGVQNGTSIVDITDAANAVEVAFISSTNSTWKDIKTYQHYAYVVNESGGGMQILDLSNLPNSVTQLTPYTGFTTSHNIFVDVPAGILYAEGSSSQPVRILSLADPEHPVQLTTTGVECHDVWAQDGVLYVSEGNHGSVGIYDVSTPGSPVRLQTINIPSPGYAHNAWGSADNRYLMTTEETNGKTIKLWDIQDINNITLTDQVLAPDGLAHNTHIKGHYAYVSHYADGLRIYDIADPNNIVEAGYYDTYSGPGGSFDGAWGAFPFFASGKVLISDMQTGLYVVFFAGAVDADPTDPNTPQDFTAYSDYTTPNSMILSWTDPAALVNGTPISPSDFTIEIDRDGSHVASVAGGTGNYVDGGLNDGQEYTYDIYAKLVANDSTSFPVETSWIAGGSPVPAPPTALSLEGNSNQIHITWKNSSRNIDGTPMDDLAGVRLYQNGRLVANFAQTSADSGATVTETFSPSTPGNYLWQVSSLDNENPQNESARSNSLYTPLGAPFADAFNVTGPPDPSRWINDGADVNNRGSNEPSAPNSLNLNGNPDGEDIVDMWPVNLSGLQGSGISFSYYYQPQGTGNAPENGDSLEVFFKNDQGRWIAVRAYPGTTLQPYQLQTIDIASAPNGGGSYFHSQFQVRFRSLGTASTTNFFDDWFIDDVLLGASVPTIAANPMDITFDTTAVGSNSVQQMEVRNVGAGDLNVSNIISTNAVFTVDIFSFTLSSGASQIVNVTFAPTGAGLQSGLLRLVSNDANRDTLDVAVQGVGATPTGIDGDGNLPRTLEVSRNFPNPFNPSTTIRYALPSSEPVQLVIYNLLGQKVRTLVNGVVEAGFHQVVWDGRNDAGAAVASGIYIYRFSAGEQFQRVQKMILLK